MRHSGEHRYLVASRVGWDGRAWDPWRSHRRNREVADGIEDRYGLRRARDHARPKAWSLTRVEHERARRGETLAKIVP